MYRKTTIFDYLYWQGGFVFVKIDTILILIFLVCTTAVFGASKHQEPGELDRLFYTDYRSDGMFVSIPGDVGNYLGLVAGSVPAALTAGTIHFFGGADYQALEAAGVTVRCFTYPLAFVVGLPFKFLKVVLWDGPASFFKELDQHNAIIQPDK